MSYRKSEVEDNRAPKKAKHTNEVCHGEAIRFSTLYSGAVYHVHSYLDMRELLLFSRISHYYRQVAMGIISPAGQHRMGKEVPYVVWDAVARCKDRSTAACGSSFSSSGSSTELQASFPQAQLPSFLEVADSAIHNYTQQRNSWETTLSTAELDAFLAMIPAPDYGAPKSARSVLLKNQFYDSLLLAPIVGRHMLQLVLDNDYLLSDLMLLSFRFPYLRSLELEAMECDWRSSGLSNQWKLRAKQIRLPSQLRSLKIKNSTKRNHCGSVVGRLLSVLAEYPLLEELQLQSMLPQFDLSSLLALPKLTKLSIADLRNYGNLPSTGGAIGHFDQRSAIQQLTRLKSLRIFNCDVLPLCLPNNCEELEEILIPWNTLTSDFRELANRVPHLRSLEVGRFVNVGEVTDWLLIDHSMLPQFQSLHTLRYSMSFQPYYEFDGYDAHMEHVISNLIQLRSLTRLDLRNFYTDVKTRSCNFNEAYFKSRRHYPNIRDTYLRNLPKRGYRSWGQNLAIEMPLLNYPYVPPHSSAPMGYQLPAGEKMPYFIKSTLPFVRMSHSVFQLTSGLPQLLSLRLSGDSAGHLPSLEFLSSLPHLQSLSLHQARYLPIESLCELEYVSSTLTHLSICESFLHASHVDSYSDVSAYLLHDVLQPLQLSFPVTQVATVKFPEHMKKPENIPDGLSLTKPVNSEVATIVFNSENTIAVDSTSSEPAFSKSTSSSSASLTSSSSSSSFVPLHPPNIEPRFSCWAEIYRLPTPQNVIFRKRFLSSIVRSYQPNVMWPPHQESEFLSDPNYQSFLSDLKEDAKRYGFHLVFDSFTVRMPIPSTDEGALLLTFNLLPNLVSCEITHQEPNGLMTFTYDRSRVPRHRMSVRGPRSEAETQEQRHDLRQKMHTLYGLEPLDRNLEIDGFSYSRFIPEDEPEKKCDTFFLLP